jgi:hypothetical protein
MDVLFHESILFDSNTFHQLSPYGFDEENDEGQSSHHSPLHIENIDQGDEIDNLSAPSPLIRRQLQSSFELSNHPLAEDLQSYSEGFGTARVRFSHYMKVVLIPTKEEYKSGFCDLWWKSRDFMKFQKSATSEIRLYSCTQNIGLMEAKKQLYQPTGEDAIDSNASSSATVLDDSYFLMDAEYMNTEFLRQRSESDESNDIKKLMEEFKNKTFIEEGETAKDHQDNLTLCVLIDDPVPAANPVRTSRISKLANAASTATNVANTIAYTAMGVVSFVAPILGYYLLNSPN